MLSLVNDSTRLVAVTGASNLLGTRPDIAAIGSALAGADALYFVDGVHLTAHASVDVRAIGADFFACSPYKFLGPHLGMLAASPALLETLHPDKLRPATEQVPERFELGTLPYELLAGVTAAIDVLADLVPGDEGTLTRRDRLVRSYAALERYEEELHGRLRAGLAAIPGVRLHGHAPLRTPTELFTVDGVDGADVYAGLAAGERQRASRLVLRDRGRRVDRAGGGRRRARRLAPYTNVDDVDRLLAGVRPAASGRPGGPPMASQSWGFQGGNPHDDDASGCGGPGAVLALGPRPRHLAGAHAQPGRRVVERHVDVPETTTTNASASQSCTKVASGAQCCREQAAEEHHRAGAEHAR